MDMVDAGKGKFFGSHQLRAIFADRRELRYLYCVKSSLFLDCVINTVHNQNNNTIAINLIAKIMVENIVTP